MLVSFLWGGWLRGGFAMEWEGYWGCQTTLTLMVGTGFCHEHALILYVYLPNDDAEDSVLTVNDFPGCVYMKIVY